MIYETSETKIVPATREWIASAAEIIKSGGLVAFPTETVYGLGANALDGGAVGKIFKAKGRPQDNPLILHVSGIRDAMKYAEVNESAEAMMHAFWPGPLTIVMFSTASADTDCQVPSVTRANLGTVALRAPLHPVAISLIESTGFPIAAPSANRSGRPSPTTAQAVADDLGDAVDLILDGGPTKIGVESTVVDATRGSVAILRPGGVTEEMLGKVVDLFEGDEGDIAHRSPGTRHRHYAPDIPLFLWDGEERDSFVRVLGVRWCYMGLREPPSDLDTSHRKAIFSSVDEYARELFTKLREFESCGGEIIIAELPDGRNIGGAVRNRLMRAAGS
ncbi:MAG: threonylcarbamoyl-AMP synthase [Synergistaceae bacterium]|jgi:L-threonylcarbamoyladenylate synthase|nr:threonylcarbamoyl-AMP synthase [Synergistaceae bacterium]